MATTRTQSTATVPEWGGRGPRSEQMTALAHAQNLPALQLIVPLQVCQGLCPKLGCVQACLQVPALDLGAQWDRSRCAWRVLLTVPATTEVHFLATHRGREI